MRHITVVVVLLGFCGMSNAAHAALIQYEFTAEVVNDSGAAVGLANGTSLNALFKYDSSAAAASTNVDGAVLGPALANYGLFSTYPAITGFSASIAGNAFASPTASVLVGDGAGDPSSGYFGTAGSAVAGWSAFDIGGSSLTGFQIFTVGSAEMLADQSLPAEWHLAGDLAFGVNSGINLAFADPTGSRIIVQVFNASIRRVPEPSVLSLMCLGLIGLARSRHRRRASVARD